MNAVERFIDYIAVEKQYSDRTVSEYRSDIASFCKCVGETPDSLDPSKYDETDVKTWMMEMLDKGNKPRSVKRRLSALSSFYRFLLRRGLVKRDITRKIVSPKADKPLPIFFKPAEMESATAYDKHADDYESMRNNLVIEILYQTGMRQSELVNLREENVDTETGEVRIFGKRKKERLVPIGNSLCEQIKAFLPVRNEWRQEHPQKAREGFLLDINSSSLYNIVRARMGEVSTLKKHSPHVLRHTFATTMLNNGANIRSIQSLLGHASLATTQVYAHTTFKQIQEAYNAAHPRAKEGAAPSARSPTSCPFSSSSRA